MRYLCIFYQTTEKSGVNRSTKKVAVAEFTSEELRKIGTVTVAAITNKLRDKYSNANYFRYIRNMESDRILLRDTDIYKLELNNNEKSRD